MKDEKKDIVSIVSTLRRSARRKFFFKNKKKLNMSWEQFDKVVMQRRGL